MGNQDLLDQFKLCEQWKDADQWDALGMLYFQRGFVLNAGLCFQRADACRINAERDLLVGMSPIDIAMAAI
jgi:hypothetical protein